MARSIGRRRVVLLEFNEITSTILDPMMARGRLPNFARLQREGAWGLPVSGDLPPYLDPWVTWVTVHTGVDRSVHRAAVLEQDTDTLGAKRTWEYVADAGRTIGVFGSVAAQPSVGGPGFVIPGPFAPTSATHPRELEAIQDLNRAYTHIHGKNQPEEGPIQMARRAAALLGLGLRPATCAAIAAQLARERVTPHERWRRCMLQPLVNFDFFAALYRQHRPDFSTWHTNHAAHLMHHYWRAMDDSGFRAPAPAEEKRRYGGAVAQGYELCDWLLGRFFELAGDDAIVAVASSMGQQPFVNDLFPEGRVVMRIRDIWQILRFVGVERGRGVEVVPVMVPQWNVKIPDDRERARVGNALRSAYAVGAPHRDTFCIEETGQVLTVTPRGLATRGEARFFFPDERNADPAGHSVDELFALDASTPKEGMHHPRGVLGLWGPGIRAGARLEGIDNLDIAPTLLTLQGLSVPEIMKGRVLSEAWEEARRPVAVTRRSPVVA